MKKIKHYDCKYYHRTPQVLSLTSVAHKIFKNKEGLYPDELEKVAHKFLYFDHNDPGAHKFILDYRKFITR